jgi:hypothetical protein
MGELSVRKRASSFATGRPAARHLVDGRQAAVLLLRRIQLRDDNRDNPTTRAQFTVPMLRRLWNRPRLSPEFLEDVSAWLAVAGWCFFNAGATYAAVRISAVKNWPRLGTGKMADELDQVAKGDFPFEDHEHLLIAGATEEERMLAEETSEGPQGADPSSEHDG